MTKEQMMDNVIRRYGFESKGAIGFCKLVEGGADESAIEYWYKILIDIDDDDDYDYEDDFDECGYNPYMGCYDFDC